MKFAPGIFLAWLLLTLGSDALCQTDSASALLKFSGDFRFRIEEDWNSRKPDGTFRENRTRLRYRVRFGAVYSHATWAEFKIGLRTGLPDKQQDPQLTIGDPVSEGAIIPVGLEKAYVKFKFGLSSVLLGKFDLPFEKNNELFWSDNVYPDGMALHHSFERIGYTGGYFILRHAGLSLKNDTYFVGNQLNLFTRNKHIRISPAHYFFKSMPHIPDVPGNDQINYSLVHLSINAILIEKQKLSISGDYYQNTSNLDQEFVAGFQNETSGWTIGVDLGNFGSMGQWQAGITYAHLEKYAIVDFLAQNDWARWDYSSAGSPDGRLSNFQGLETVLSYKIDEAITITSKFYLVQQLRKLGTHLETGSRIRFDLDFKVL